MDANNIPTTTIHKIVVIGNTGVGKTNIITRYVHNKFDNNAKATIGAEFYEKEINIIDEGEEDKVKISIWDTAGQERFRGLVSSYYRNASGILLVYDISEKSTFDDLSFWINEMSKYGHRNAEVFLIGNKKDLIDLREVSKDEGLALAEKKGFTFYETTALNIEDNTIENMFKDIVLKIRDNDGLRDLGLSGLNDAGISIGTNFNLNRKKKDSGCC